MNNTESQLRAKAEARQLVDYLALSLGLQMDTRAWPVLGKLANLIEQAILAAEERGRQQALKMIPDALRRIQQLGLDAAQGIYVGVDPAQAGGDFTAKWVPDDGALYRSRELADEALKKLAEAKPAESEAAWSADGGFIIPESIAAELIPILKSGEIVRMAPGFRICGPAPVQQDPAPEPQRVNFREFL